MSGGLAIVRLLARRGTLWNLLVFGVMAAVFGRVALDVQLRVDSELAGALGASERGWQIAALLFTGGAGILLGWAVNELLLTPQAPLLPGIRRELRRGLLALGGASATAAALAYAAAGGTHPWPMVLASGACAFGVGAWVSDPLLPRGSGTVTFLVACGGLAWQPRILQALASAPLASSAALIALGLAGIELLLRPGALRRRPGLAPMDLGAAYRSDASTVNWTTAGMRGQRLRVRLPRERIEGDGGWMRAALVENFGWRQGGLAGAILGHAFAWTFLLLGARLAPAFLSADSTGLSGLGESLRESLEAGSNVAGVVAMISGFFWIANSFSLHTSAGYPISREQRARALWRAALLTNVGLHLALALALLTTSLVLARVAGEGWRAPSPALIHVLVLSLLAAPFVQGARLSCIDSKARSATSREIGIFCGVSMAGLAAALVLGAELCGELLPGVPPGLQALTALALFAAVQSLWREFLVRRLRTCELVT